MPEGLSVQLNQCAKGCVDIEEAVMLGALSEVHITYETRQSVCLVQVC